MRRIDGKYQTDGTLTKNDGTPIPDDEPLMLFRGKDQLLPDVVEYYADMCEAAGSPEEHVQTLREKADNIRAWQNDNPDSAKIPD